MIELFTFLFFECCNDVHCLLNFWDLQIHIFVAPHQLALDQLVLAYITTVLLVCLIE